ARDHGQVDAVVGDQAAEALGDAAQFEFQLRHPPVRAGARAAGPSVTQSIRSSSSGQAAGSGETAHFGWAAEVTVILPSMMSCLSLSTSDLRSAAIFASNSWYGAIDTPLFFSVPTAPPEVDPPEAALTARSRTASGMFFTTVVRKFGQYLSAEVQPSTSTQITLSLSGAAAATVAVPMPVPPATGMITSAPWAVKDSVSDLPLFWSTKLSANVPLWAALSQPRTCTFLLLASLNFFTPSAKPSMKMVTGGILMPPYVATLPDLEYPAARYPARSPAWA